MLLIKKFNDYYDMGLSYGIDNKIVYRRIPETYFAHQIEDPASPEYVREIKRIIQLAKGNESLNYPYFLRNLCMIGFCGVVYAAPIIDLKKGLYLSDPDGSKVFWLKEDLPDLSKTDFYNHFTPYMIERIEKWIEKNPLTTNVDFTDKLIELGIVSFSYMGGILTINPKLRDLDFHRVIDPLSAFQKISMFISGLPEKPEPVTTVGSDKDIRDSKGFDNASFKNRSKSK